MKIKDILINGNENIKGCLIINLVGHLKIKASTNLNIKLKANQIKLNTNQNPYYLSYIFNSSIERFKRIQNISVIPFYKKRELLNFNFEIELLSIEKQNYFVKLFQCLEEKIEIEKKSILLKENLLKAIIERTENLNEENLLEIKMAIEIFTNRNYTNNENYNSQVMTA